MIWNLGSINADNFYRVPHLPAPGETLAATAFHQGLGGKGANMSVAAARAGARVQHIGAIGPDGGWTRNRLLEYGVEVGHIARIDVPTGHANISVDPAGENVIVLLPGANQALTQEMIGAALSSASAGDVLLMQNETNLQKLAAEMARTLGLRVTYAAAPFSAEAVAEVMSLIDLLVLNEVEAAQLTSATGQDLTDLPVPEIIVTLGAQGCRRVGKQERTYPAYPAQPVDTTGAGDTFTGYLVAGLDRGLGMDEAIDLALRAAALMVMREGTADVIPDLLEIQNHDFGTS